MSGQFLLQFFSFYFHFACSLYLTIPLFISIPCFCSYRVQLVDLELKKKPYTKEELCTFFDITVSIGKPDFSFRV